MVIRRSSLPVPKAEQVWLAGEAAHQELVAKAQFEAMLATISNELADRVRGIKDAGNR